MTNDELQRCHFHIQIPANPVYSSLNLAAAVQIIAYELFVVNAMSSLQEDEWEFRFATADDMEKFFVHLQKVLVEIEFLKLSAPRKLMTRLRRLFLRARPDVNEMNILRGMLTAVQHQLGK